MLNQIMISTNLFVKEQMATTNRLSSLSFVKRLPISFSVLDQMRLSPTINNTLPFTDVRDLPLLFPRKEKIDIGLVLPSLIFTPRFISKNTLNQQKITHCVSVRHPQEINEELRVWLRTAYEMNQPPSNL